MPINTRYINTRDIPLFFSFLRMAIPTVLRKTVDAFCLLLFCFVCWAGGSSLGFLFSRYIQVSKYASCGLSSSSTSSAIFVKILWPWTIVLLLDISNTNMCSACYFQGICLRWLLQNTQATKTAGALHTCRYWQLHICRYWQLHTCRYWQLHNCRYWQLHTCRYWQLHTCRYWQLHICRYWQLHTCRYWQLHTCRYWQLHTCRYWQLHTCRYWQLHICRYWQLHICRYWQLHICRYWQLHTCRYWQLHICRYWQLHICRYWQLHICRYWQLHTCRYWQLQLQKADSDLWSNSEQWPPGQKQQNMPKNQNPSTQPVSAPLPHSSLTSKTCQKIRTPPHSLSPPLYPTPASPVKHAKKSEPLHTACLRPSTPLQPHQ